MFPREGEGRDEKALGCGLLAVAPECCRTAVPGSRLPSRHRGGDTQVPPQTPGATAQADPPRPSVSGSGARLGGVHLGTAGGL